MLTTTDLELLSRQLDADPTDWQLRLVYADAWEECGDLVRAGYYRWSAGYGFSPEYSKSQWCDWQEPQWWFNCYCSAQRTTAETFWHRKCQEWQWYPVKPFPTRTAAEEVCMAFFVEHGYPE